MLEDADKAAAIKEYVAAWAKAQLWINEHPEEFAKAFYVEHEGLPPRTRRASSRRSATFDMPTNWDDVDRPPPGDRRPARPGAGPRELDVEDLYDRRFEKVAAEALARRRSHERTASRPPATRRPASTTPGRTPPARARAAGSRSAFWSGRSCSLGLWCARLRDRLSRPAHPLGAVDRRRHRQRPHRDGRLQDNLLDLRRPGRCSAWRFGVVVGTVLALVAGLSRIGEAIIDGPVQIKRSIPSLALIPLLILWFGIGEEMKVITIALGVLVPVYIHTHNGLRSIDGRYAELAETVGVSRAEFVRHVVLPGALPGFLLGHAVRGHLGAARPGRRRADQRDQRHRPHDHAGRQLRPDRRHRRRPGRLRRPRPAGRRRRPPRSQRKALAWRRTLEG